MRHAGVIVIAAVVSACGGDGSSSVDAPGSVDATPGADAPPAVTDPPDADDRSGTRLKRRLLVAGDGFRVQVGWFDSLLAVDCAFRRLADGSSRCVPGATQVTVRYRDQTCTDRVFWSSSTLPGGPAYYQTSEGCQVRYWRDPQAVAVPSPLYMVDFSGACVMTSPTGGTYYTATEVPSTDFVAETLTLEPAGSELMLRVRTTADGARELLHLFAPALDSGCRYDRMPDGSVRCAPRLFADPGEQSPPSFADAACTQSVRTYAPCEAVPEHKLFTTTPRACAPSHEYAPISPYSGPVYDLIGAQCTAATSTTGVHGLVGARLPSSAFVVETSRALGEGATRIRRGYSVYADGTIGPRELWDSRHGVECRARDGSGVERCEPTAYLDRSAAFADAACTQPLADSSGDPCPAELRPAWARGAAGAYHRVTGEHVGTTAYVMGTSGCTQVPVDIPLFTIDPTAVTDWEPFTPMTEP